MTEYHDSTAPCIDAPVSPSERAAAQGSATDPRMLAVWREWLSALAKDPEAVLAAAHVYSELSSEARDAWLDALAEDGPTLLVPPVAVYAPLLGVEFDPERRDRIQFAMASECERISCARDVRVLRGIAPDGSRVAALIATMYLDFVRVLWCRYSPDYGFRWAKHNVLMRREDAPQDGSTEDGVRLETTPLKPVIEELAHAVLAQGRLGEELPESLYLFANLFDAEFDSETVE